MCSTTKFAGMWVFFIAANAHTALVKEAERVEIEGTHVVRFGLKICVVAVEPVDTPMGFEVRLIQNTPDT